MFPLLSPLFRVSSLNRPEKKKRKKLMKDSLNLAAMLRRFAREKEEIRKKQPGVVKVTRGPNAANATATPNPAATQRPPVAVLNSHPLPGNAVPLGTAVTTPGGDFNMSDLTTDPAVMSLLGGAHDNEMLQDLMGDLDFGLLDSPTPASPRQQAENGNLLPGGQKAVVGPGGVAAAGRIPKGPLNPPPLPSGLPGPLVKRIEDLRAVSSPLPLTHWFYYKSCFRALEFLSWNEVVVGRYFFAAAYIKFFFCPSPCVEPVVHLLYA